MHSSVGTQDKRAVVTNHLPPGFVHLVWFILQVLQVYSMNFISVSFLLRQPFVICWLPIRCASAPRSNATVYAHAQSSGERGSKSTQATCMSTHRNPNFAGQQPLTAFEDTVEQPIKPASLHWLCLSNVMEMNLTLLFSQWRASVILVWEGCYKASG